MLLTVQSTRQENETSRQPISLNLFQKDRSVTLPTERDEIHFSLGAQLAGIDGGNRETGAL
jgi:hypothetical protein